MYRVFKSLHTQFTRVFMSNHSVRCLVNIFKREILKQFAVNYMIKKFYEESSSLIYQSHCGKISPKFEAKLRYIFWVFRYYIGFICQF